MTREEAILLLHDMKDTYDEIHENTNYEIGYEQMTALDMAIEALQREEAEAKGYCHRIRPSNVEVVVRCKDCKHYRAEYGSCTAEHWDLSRVTFPHVEPNDYCSYGEKKK